MSSGATIVRDVWASFPFTKGIPYSDWLPWRIGVLRKLVLAERATWPLRDAERRERRLASYWRYRNSGKGWARTRRYNESEKHLACCCKYRAWHPRTEASYQRQAGTSHPYWVHSVKVDPNTSQILSSQQ